MNFEQESKSEKEKNGGGGGGGGGGVEGVSEFFDKLTKKYPNLKKLLVGRGWG